MIVEKILIFVPSFLEAISIVLILSTINRNGIIGIPRTMVYAVSLSFLSLVMDAFQVSFHMIISILASVFLYLLLKWPTRVTIGKYTIDVLFSIGILTFFQFVSTVIAGLLSIDLLLDNTAMICAMAIIILVFALLSKNIYVNAFFEKYYIPYRETILLSVLSLLLLITIVTNLHLYHEKVFVVGAEAQIYLVILGYFFVNLISCFSLFRISKVNKERIASIKYGDNLLNIVNQYSKLVHEHRHHLQIIVALNLDEQGRIRNEELDQYIESLISDDKKISGASIINDDFLISALLYQKQDLAKRSMISFEINTEGSLSVYSIPQTALIDVLNNLINNSFEEVEKLPSEKRYVSLNFRNNTIEIINRLSYRPSQSEIGISRFFEQGYSTKGPGRGFGLSNVLTIAEKYNIRIQYELKNDYFVVKLVFRPPD